MVGHLNGLFGPEGREFEQANLQKFKCPGVSRGGMLNFRIDRRITLIEQEIFAAGLVFKSAGAECFFFLGGGGIYGILSVRLRETDVLPNYCFFQMFRKF